MTISWAGPDHGVGGAGSPSGMVELLRAKRMARRYAAVVSFGSCCRFVWMLVTNAELTAENKPASELGQFGSSKIRGSGVSQKRASC